MGSIFSVLLLWVWNTFQLGYFGGNCVWMLFMFLFFFWHLKDVELLLEVKIRSGRISFSVLALTELFCVIPIVDLY